MSNYTSKNIRILKDTNTIIFNKISNLSKKYPWIAEEAIKRLVEASYLASLDLEQVVDRYLNFNKNIKITEEFIEIYKELADQRRYI